MGGYCVRRCTILETTMPQLKPGRKPSFTPQYHPSGLLRINQGEIHGIPVSYDPDWNAFCVHGDYDIVLFRFDVTRASAIRNVVQRCREVSVQNSWKK